jgi:hypothetical protein
MSRKIFVCLQWHDPVFVFQVFLGPHPSLKHLMVADPKQVKVSNKADFGIFDISLPRLPVISLIPECEHRSSEL